VDIQDQRIFESPYRIGINLFSSDFCLVNDHTPELLIETKRSDSNPGKALMNFHQRYGIPGIQLVLHLKQEKKEKGIEIQRGETYLRSLLM